MNKATILIVEDDAILAMALRGKISELGYAVAGPFAFGEEAIAFLPDKQVDLILMDIELAGDMNGITTAEKLLRTADIPVVFLTGFSQNNLLEQAKSVSPYGYLVKPVSDQALAATLEMSLHRHKVDMELKESRNALAKSEERLNLSERIGKLGNWEYNVADCTIAWSEQAYNLYERDPKTGPPTTDQERIYYREEVITRLRGYAKKVIESGESFEGYEFTVNLASGRKPIFIGSMFPIKDATGQVVKLFGTFQDITERKQAEEEQRRLQAQLHQAQKMEAIGTLAGGIAHDFNNILGAILGYAEMVQEDSPAGSMVRKDIDQVVKASHRAKDLVKQILAFSRQAETEHIPLQPAIIIKEAVKMLRSSLPSTIAIQQKIDPEAGLILADPTQIHQVMVNLCTNAFHAMEETGGTLTISLKQKTLSLDDLGSEPHVQPGDFVQLSIGDTGPGIAPEIREKIFDPYFTTKEVGKGTGMGLAIIHGVVKSYKGLVTFHSGPGEGTVFHVYLPVIEDPTVLEGETVPPDIEQLGNERILFIDDEEILAEVGQSMLERLGYLVTVRRNSLEALNTFQNHPDEFDLVITDQTMPGMTGSDLARRMLQIRPGIPIILCTGYSSLITEDKAKSLGIKGFAMKPLAKKEIAAIIRKVLDTVP